jgi:hypothetical protein
MLRAGAGALVIAVLLSSAAASARSLERLFFRIELATGKVRQLSALPEPPRAPPWPEAPTDALRSMTARNGTLILLERDRARPNANEIRWQHTVETGKGWFPWQVLQGSLVTFLWREEVAGHPGQYREIIRAIDLETHQVLWSRVSSLHDPAGAHAFGRDHILVDRASEVLLLETKTGRQVRSFPKRSGSFAVAQPAPGRFWLEAGERIECLDEATTDTVWWLSKEGALRWLLPIPGSDDWLIKTSSHAYRIDPKSGHATWSSKAPSDSGPLLSGNRSYEASLEGRSEARLVLVARDLRNGKVLRRYTVGRYRSFFDQGRVSAVAVTRGSVDVAADFLVLD